MTEHTPGPWVNMPDGAFWGEIRSAETFDLIAVMPELDDRTADFELIAAAPDLLAACEAVAEATGRDLTEAEMCRGVCHVPLGLIEAMDDAIAKARGGG